VIEISAFESHLSQQGRFCLVDWLLAEGFLAYSDYESWRYGKYETLDGLLRLESSELSKLFVDVEECSQDLGLAADPQEFYRWGSDQRMLLNASEDEQQGIKLTQCWLRPQDLPQLDLFMDNSAQVAESLLLENFAGRQFEVAQSQLQSIVELDPECPRLGGYQDLINYGLHMIDCAVIDSAELNAELQGLRQEVQPLALDTLGQASRDYLSFAWRRLADNARSNSFDSESPDLHASALLFEIPDYQAVVDCLLDTSDLYQTPVLLERLALGLGLLHQNEKALMAWCLLMECDAEYAEQSLEQHRWRLIYTLWQDFWEVTDDWSEVFFPAYVLARRPDLAQLKEFPPLQNSASVNMQNLLLKRLNREDEVAARKALKDISPELLSVYLGRR